MCSMIVTVWDFVYIYSSYTLYGGQVQCYICNNTDENKMKMPDPLFIGINIKSLISKEFRLNSSSVGGQSIKT